ncbi:MAG: hypothetical protein H8E62_00155 [Planctomycetes bacterium]|nr:hypothetical protein [Planctomycetota bacterium]
MKKGLKITIIVIGILLVGNGIANIFDDARVLTYDITSILAGLGFLVMSTIK